QGEGDASDARTELLRAVLVEGRHRLQQVAARRADGGQEGGRGNRFGDHHGQVSGDGGEARQLLRLALAGGGHQGVGVEVEGDRPAVEVERGRRGRVQLAHHAQGPAAGREGGGASWVVEVVGQRPILDRPRREVGGQPVEHRLEAQEALSAG